MINSKAKKISKKYRLIALSFTIVALFAGITVYALMGNDSEQSGESNISSNQTLSSESGEFVPDVFWDTGSDNSRQEVQAGNTSVQTHINKTKGENGDIYEFTLEDINREKNGIKVGYTEEIGDYKYTYGYTATRPGGTIENGGLVPQDTGYELGWHAEVTNKNKESYGPLCEYIYGIPVTDVTYLFAECSNIAEDGYPNLPRFVEFKDGWRFD